MKLRLKNNKFRHNTSPLKGKLNNSFTTGLDSGSRTGSIFQVDLPVDKLQNLSDFAHVLEFGYGEKPDYKNWK